jgi:hypothetical protein
VNSHYDLEVDDYSDKKYVSWCLFNKFVNVPNRKSDACNLKADCICLCTARLVPRKVAFFVFFCKGMADCSSFYKEGKVLENCFFF